MYEKRRACTLLRARYPSVGMRGVLHVMRYVRSLCVKTCLDIWKETHFSVRSEGGVTRHEVCEFLSCRDMPRHMKRYPSVRVEWGVYYTSWGVHDMPRGMSYLRVTYVLLTCEHKPRYIAKWPVKKACIYEKRPICMSGMRRLFQNCRNRPRWIGKRRTKKAYRCEKRPIFARFGALAILRL